MKDELQKLTDVRRMMSDELEESREKVQQTIEASEQSRARSAELLAKFTQLTGKNIERSEPVAPQTTSLRIVGQEVSFDDLVHKAHAKGYVGTSINDLLSQEEIDSVYADFRRIRAENVAAARTGLIEHSKKQMLQTLVTAFGLGGLFAVWDRVGGSVLTLNTAISSLSVSDSELDQYPDPERLRAFREHMNTPFERSGYDKGLSAKRSTFVSDPNLEDAYTSRPLDPMNMDVDHVISARELHGDKSANLWLDSEQVQGFATSDENMAPTSASINRSKKDAPLMEWAEREGGDKREPNRERYDLDMEATRKADDRAREALEQQINKERVSQHVVAFGKDTAQMALQQALGVLLLELVVALYEELSAHWRDKGVSEALGDRFARVAQRVAAKRYDALSAGLHGGFAGFVSSLVTAIASSIFKVGKRAVRMIREGIMGAWRAMWLVARAPSTPEGREQAYLDALRILSATTGVVVGVGLAEGIQHLVASTIVLSPFAGLVSEVVGGILGGLFGVYLVHIVEQSPMFNLTERKIEQDILVYLDFEIDEIANAHEVVFEDFALIKA